MTKLSINKWTQPWKPVGVFQNRRVCGQAFPPFPSPPPHLLPLFCSRLIFRAARMRKNSFARPEFRSRGTGTLATQASRTLADFLSRLTALRLGAGSFKIKMAPIPLTWLSWHFLRFQMSDFARQAPILSQTCLNSPHTNRQVKIFCRPTKNRLVCGDLYRDLYGDAMLVPIPMGMSFATKA